jgi:hypothetical protein
MRRHLVGIVSLLLLLGATVAWFSTAAGQYAELEAMAWRVGAFLAVCWLAYPDVDRLPGWLLAALPIFVVAIAVRPRLVLLAIPALIVLALIKPRWGRRGQR